MPVFQLIILLFATTLINQIPKSALAGLLMWIGWKLCSHKVFKRIFSVGKEQMFVALVNVVVTLWTSDLLDGMIVGTATKIVLLVKDVVFGCPRVKGWGPHSKNCSAIRSSASETAAVLVR